MRELHMLTKVTKQVMNFLKEYYNVVVHEVTCMFINFEMNQINN